MFHIANTGMGAASVWELRGGKLWRTSTFQAFETAVRACLQCFDAELPYDIESVCVDSVLAMGPCAALRWLRCELTRCGWPTNPY